MIRGRGPKAGNHQNKLRLFRKDNVRGTSTNLMLCRYLAVKREHLRYNHPLAYHDCGTYLPCYYACPPQSHCTRKRAPNRGRALSKRDSYGRHFVQSPAVFHEIGHARCRTLGRGEHSSHSEALRRRGGCGKVQRSHGTGVAWGLHPSCLGAAPDPAPRSTVSPRATAQSAFRLGKLTARFQGFGPR
jgi:hypothetical protein